MDDRGHLLRLDPDLGEGLDGERLRLAEQHLLVRLTHLRTGDWQPDPDAFAAEGGIGLLMTRGFLVREVALGHRGAAELLGPGDLLRPWQDGGEHTIYPYTASWRVLAPVSFAVLDPPFGVRSSRFPEVTANLVGRVMARSRRSTGQVVLSQFASVEHRVLLALWHMSDDWGRVRPDGIVVPIPLTHKLLGLIVGARRPSVTAALGSLARQGLACPEADGGFLLTGEPPTDLQLVRGAGRQRLPADGSAPQPAA